jgi:hypothetical protein
VRSLREKQKLRAFSFQGRAARIFSKGKGSLVIQEITFQFCLSQDVAFHNSLYRIHRPAGLQIEDSVQCI